MKCTLCKRDGELEFHHFYPGKGRRKDDSGIDVCNQCGDQIHLLFTNTELRNDYNTLDKLLESNRMKTYIKWVKDKPIESHFSMKKKKRK